MSGVQQPQKGIDMQTLLKLYNSNKKTINRTFGEFMQVISPVFKGSPDFTDVTYADMNYTDDQEWDCNDINLLIGMMLQSENIRFDLIGKRINDMNSINWATLEDLVEKKNIKIPENSAVNQAYMKRQIQKIDSYKKKYEEMETKYTEHASQYKELSNKYTEHVNQYKELSDKYTELENKYKNLVDACKKVAITTLNPSESS
jgi:hypothetical protein